MDKLQILRSVASSKFHCLEPMEIRMYLLLLANSEAKGEGAISASSLRQAFIPALQRERLLTICRKLQEQGMIKGLQLLPDESEDHNAVVQYGIAGVEEAD